MRSHVVIQHSFWFSSFSYMLLPTQQRVPWRSCVCMLYLRDGPCLHDAERWMDLGVIPNLASPMTGIQESPIIPDHGHPNCWPWIKEGNRYGLRRCTSRRCPRYSRSLACSALAVISHVVFPSRWNSFGSSILCMVSEWLYMWFRMSSSNSKIEQEKVNYLLGQREVSLYCPGMQNDRN